MPYKRQVQVGRVALINYGPDAGKLCTIINIIDQNRVLVDGPEAVTGCHRHAVGIKRIALTDITVPVTLNATHKCARHLCGLWCRCQGTFRAVRIMRCSFSARSMRLDRSVLRGCAAAVLHLSVLHGSGLGDLRVRTRAKGCSARTLPAVRASLVRRSFLLYDTAAVICTIRVCRRVEGLQV